jgi:hypothetical protein
MVDVTKYASARFIKLEDVQDQPRRETIVEVTEGQYGKLVLKFKSGRRFSLNGTNVSIMIAAFGDESDHWGGVEIELYAGETKYNGDARATVLIRPPPRRDGQPKSAVVDFRGSKRQPKSATAEFNDEIPY